MGTRRSPAWSPGGERLAFTSNRGGSYDIYVMNADGSNPARLTTDAEFDAFPEWSPDGQSIAFRSDRAGNLEVFVMAADGSGQFNWTSHPAGDCHPRWKAAGSAMVVPLRRVAEAAPAAMVGRAGGGAAVRGSIPDRCVGD